MISTFGRNYHTNDGLFGKWSKSEIFRIDWLLITAMVVMALLVMVSVVILLVTDNADNFYISIKISALVIILFLLAAAGFKMIKNKELDWQLIMLASVWCIFLPIF